MFFTVVGEISHIETFAVGAEIREVERLRKLYGRGRWRKRTTASIWLRFTGMKQPASARKSSRSSASSRPAVRSVAKAATPLVICINNEGYEASLEVRKIYRTVADEDARQHRLLRVVDESGDDYLFPLRNFLPVILPQATRRAVLAVA